MRKMLLNLLVFSWLLQYAGKCGIDVGNSRSILWFTWIHILGYFLKRILNLLTCTDMGFDHCLCIESHFVENNWYSDFPCIIYITSRISRAQDVGNDLLNEYNSICMFISVSNIALHKQAYQSSDYERKPYVASRAVDGKKYVHKTMILPFNLTE